MLNPDLKCKIFFRKDSPYQIKTFTGLIDQEQIDTFYYQNNNEFILVFDKYLKEPMTIYKGDIEKINVKDEDGKYQIWINTNNIVWTSEIIELINAEIF